MNELSSELFIVIGGGCFGGHHVRHIEKGRSRGRISPEARIVVVDRNERPPARDVPGVDTLLIKDYIEARDRLLSLAARPDTWGKGVVVGTVSSCHGAVSLLRLLGRQSAVPGPRG